MTVRNPASVKKKIEILTMNLFLYSGKQYHGELNINNLKSFMSTRLRFMFLMFFVYLYLELLFIIKVQNLKDEMYPAYRLTKSYLNLAHIS